MTVIVHEFDVAHDLGIPDPARLLDPAGLAGHSAALAALLRDRLQIWAAAGAPARHWSAAIRCRTGRHQMRVRYERPRRPSLTVAARLFPYDPVHQTFVNVYERDAVTTQAILGAERQSWCSTRAPARASSPWSSASPPPACTTS